MKRQKWAFLLAAIGSVAVLISGCMNLEPVGPQALFTVSQQKHVIPFDAVFDGTMSYNSSGQIVSYSWTVGNEILGSGPVIGYEFQDDGTYLVTLTVVDSEGRSSSTSAEVEALNPPPTADFTYSHHELNGLVYVGASEEITLDASRSADDGQIVEYRWDFGDGNAKTGKTVTHKWMSGREDPYHVTLTVKDDDGAEATFAQDITVRGGGACTRETCGDGTCQ